MIDRIYIPTLGRHDNQITYNSLSAKWKKIVTMVVTTVATMVFSTMVVIIVFSTTVVTTVFSTMVVAMVVVTTVVTTAETGVDR